MSKAGLELPEISEKDTAVEIGYHQNLLMLISATSQLL